MDRDTTLAADHLDDRRFAALLAIVREAGELTMRHFRIGARVSGRVDWKEGGSPVTEVDFAVDRLLRERLSELLPDAGWLSEETADTPDRLSKRTVWIVDPIDGTRGFMEGDPRFVVSVALVVDGRPVAAVLDAPALNHVYSARAGQGAHLNDQRVEAPSDASVPNARIAGPKFLIEAVAQKLKMAAQPKVPSLALRFAQVASGDFEVAVASSDAHDWDVAGADLILNEAGARLLTPEGAALVYNRNETKHGILIAAADPFQSPVRGILCDVSERWRKSKITSKTRG